MFFRLKDFNFVNKKVLLRTDFNVPLQDGKILDDSRIRKALPTINYILEQKPRRIVLMSHMGRPKNDYVPELSMRPVFEHLKKLLNKDMFFETNPRINNIANLEDKQIVMIENLRFEPVEKDNNEDFARKLASFAEVFVLDAFATAHRAHASIAGVPKFIPSCAGLLLEKEIEMLYEKMQNPSRPFVAIIGGAKADKIQVIDHLLQKVENLIIGGVLANTFLKTKGYDIGASVYTEESLESAKALLDKYPKKIDLPVDFIMGDKFTPDAKSMVAGLNDNLDGWMILDVGPYTRSGYIKILDRAKTVVWAGPIGVFEWENFRRGTSDIAKFLAGKNITKIIGGGESAAAIKMLNLENKMTHVSTGGGACLELLAGHELPGIKALEENYEKFKK